MCKNISPFSLFASICTASQSAVQLLTKHGTYFVTVHGVYVPDILKKAHIPYIWRVCYPFFGEMMQSSVFYGKTGVHIWHIWRFFRAICQICPRERLHGNRMPQLMLGALK